MKYHPRNLVETVFSVLKRKFGESLKARNYRNQIKELKIKIDPLRYLKNYSPDFNLESDYKEFYRTDIQ